MCHHVHSCFHILYLTPGPWIGFLTNWASSLLSLLQKQLQQYQPLKLCLNQGCSPEQELALQRMFWLYPFTVLWFTLQSDSRVREWVFFQMKQWIRMILRVYLGHFDLPVVLCTRPDCSWSGESSRYKIHTAWALAHCVAFQICSYCSAGVDRSCTSFQRSWFFTAAVNLFVILTFENCLCHIRSTWDCEPQPSSNVELILFLRIPILYPSTFMDFCGDSLYVIRSETHTEMYLLFGEMSCLWPYSAYCKCSLWEAYWCWPK